MSLDEGMLQLQAVALAVTSRTMVKFGYTSRSCAVFKCSLLLMILDVDVCTGKCPGQGAQGIIKKDVGSPGAYTTSP